MEKENKRKNKKIIYVIIILGVLVVFGCSFWVIKSSDFLSKLSSKNEETVELKHTEVVTVKSDGVYITDVSEVVDEVMPSIVSITSKTVISSGRFGPSFYGNGSYTTEALVLE